MGKLIPGRIRVAPQGTLFVTILSFRNGATRWVVAGYGVRDRFAAFHVVTFCVTRVIIAPCWSVRICQLLIAMGMVQITEVLVEVVSMRKVLIEASQVVLTELGGRVALRLENVCLGNAFFLKAGW